MKKELTKYLCAFLSVLLVVTLMIPAGPFTFAIGEDSVSTQESVGGDQSSISPDGADPGASQDGSAISPSGEGSSSGAGSGSSSASDNGSAAGGSSSSGSNAASGSSSKSSGKASAGPNALLDADGSANDSSAGDGSDGNGDGSDGDGNANVAANENGDGSVSTNLNGATITARWKDGSASKTTITDNATKISVDRVGSPWVSGEFVFHCNEGVTYEPGSIKIYVPDALFLSREGGSVYNNSAVQLGVPKAPNTNTESSFNYTYDSTTKCKVITNWETINSTLDFKCEFKYQVDYKQWNGVYEICSGQWFDCPIYATIQDQDADEPAKLEAPVLQAQVLTDVIIDSKNVYKKKSDRYVKWQSTWGEQPEGITDDEYSYYVFEIRGSLDSYYMPYKVQFVEKPSDGGIPLKWSGSGMYTSNEDGKNIRGWQSFTDDTYTTDWSSWRNLGVAYGYPYVYTVVAYPKEAEADGKEMTNEVTFRLQGRDHDYVQEAPAKVTFKNTAAPFSYEGDKYYVQKATASAYDYGGINLLRLGKQSGVMTFYCRTSMQCYDQTKDDEGNYGKRNWTAELIDDQLYLEDELLQPGDYEFTGFKSVHYTYTNIEDDPDRGTYKKVSKDLGTNDDPNVTFSLYYRTSPDGEWILFDTYDKDNPLGSSTSIDMTGTHAMQVKWVVNSNAYSVYSGNTVCLVRLNPTEHVLSLLEGKTSATITNVDAVRALNDKGELLGTTSSVDLRYSKFNSAVAQHDQEGGYGLSAGEYLMHDAAYYRVTATDSAMTMSKNAALSKTDDVNRNYIIEYTAIQSMTCGIYDATWEDYRQLVGGNVGQTVIYDLLPEGMSYDGKGITVTYSGRDAEGLYVTAGNTASFKIPVEDVSVKQVKNWQGSGRTMLITTVQLPDEKIANPSVKLVYKCIYPWDSAMDYGYAPVNDVASYTDDLTFTKCYGDSPSAPRGGQSSSSNETWKAYFNDLDGDGVVGDGENASTAYASKSISLSRLGVAESGYTKKVKADEDIQYTKSAETYASGAYSYRLRFSPEDGTSSKGLVFYDTLEEAYGDNAHWKGSFVSVDTSYATRNGVDAKVYYSTVAGCDPNNVEADRDLTDTSKWSTVEPEDPSQVTAVAIDLTHNQDGSEYVIKDGQIVLVMVNMMAPENVVPYVHPEKLLAYNVSTVSSQVKKSDDAEFEEAAALLTKETTVGLRVEERDLVLTKEVAGEGADEDAQYEFTVSLSQLVPGKSYDVTCSGELVEGSGAGSGSGSDDDGTGAGTGSAVDATAKTVTADGNGCATFRVRLADGQKLKMTLPLCAHYSVTEAGAAENLPSYKVTCDDGDDEAAGDSAADEAVAQRVGDELATGERRLDGDTTVAFTNTYKPIVPTSASIFVKKELQVPEGADEVSIDGAYTFTLADDPSDDVESPLPDDATVTCEKPGDIMGFDEVTFTEAGTYRYLVTESGELGKVSNDPEAKSGKAVTVVIADDGMSNLYVSEISATEDDPVTFTNVSKPVVPVTVQVPVKKELDVPEGADEVSVAGAYTFAIADDPSDDVKSPLPEKATVACGEAGETVLFDGITFSRPGTYSYVVTESGELGKVANDPEAESGKTVKIVVADDGCSNLYVKEASYTEDEPLTFTNVSKPVVPVSAQIPVRKELLVPKGADAVGIEGAFTFELADDPSDQVESPLPDNAAVACGKAGETVLFDEVTFIKAGTYSYLVTESGKMKDVQNDPEAKSGKAVTVVVEDDGYSNLYVAEMSSTEAEPVTFANQVTVHDVPVQPDEPGDSDEPGDDDTDSDEPADDGHGWLPTTNDPMGALVLALGAAAAVSLICLVALGIRRRRRE